MLGLFKITARKNFLSKFVLKKKLNSKQIILFLRHQDELIVTPFAQILASLKNVRQNFVTLSNDK